MSAGAPAATGSREATAYQPSSSRRSFDGWLRPMGVFWITLLLGVLALARSQQFYGTLHRGYDPQFYYALAHSLLFDQDVDISDNLRLSPTPRVFDRDGNGHWENLPLDEAGRVVNKCAAGVAVLQMPFLLGGHLVRTGLATWGLRLPGPVGYSELEFWAVAGGMLALLAWALACLYGLVAQEYGKRAALFGVVAAWMGTSLFYYSTVFPFMPHSPSFALLVASMCLTRKLDAPGPLNRTLALLGLCLASLLFLRPQQVLVGLFLLPALVRAVRLRPMGAWVPGAALGAGACAAVVLAQAAFNATQFGAFTFNGYAASGEGFRWWDPQLSLVLTSSSRGVLVFSPVLALAALGFIVQRRSIPAYVWPQFLNLLAQVYLVAAWSAPFQGSSFGSRMLSDNAAVVAFGLAAAIHPAPAVRRWVVSSAAVVLVCWTMLQMTRYMLDR